MEAILTKFPKVPNQDADKTLAVGKKKSKAGEGLSGVLEDMATAFSPEEPEIMGVPADFLKWKKNNPGKF